MKKQSQSLMKKFLSEKNWNTKEMKSSRSPKLKINTDCSGKQLSDFVTLNTGQFKYGKKT